jgi:hypothetical protein
MAARFWVGGTGTWDNVSTTNWATTSGGASGAAAPTISDAVTFDGNSGASAVITTNANVTALSVALGTTGGNFTGTLDFSAHNNSPTFTAFAFGGSGARTLNLGSGTFTISNNSSAIPWDMSTLTGPLTFNAGTSTLVFSGTTVNGRLITLGNGLTYSTVTVGPGTAGVVSNFSSTNVTIGTLNLTTGFLFPTSGTTIISTALNVTGSSGSPISIGSANVSLPATVSVVGTSAIIWAGIQRLAFTTSAVIATNAFDFGGNSMNGGSITQPSGGGGARMIGG